MSRPVVRPRSFVLSIVLAAVSLFAMLPGLVRAEEADIWSGSTTVTVTLSSYQFSPAHLDLQRGKPYRLHLVNSSGKGHDFSAPGLFASSTVAPGDRGKISDGAVEVDSGSSVDVTLIPSTPGDYAVECTHFLHAAFGMRATIAVK